MHSFCDSSAPFDAFSFSFYLDINGSSEKREKVIFVIFPVNGNDLIVFGMDRKLLICTANLKKR